MTFLLPSQGLFNALIYFHVTTKQQSRRGSTAEQGSRSSSFFALPPFQLWGSFRRSFSRGRSSGRRADPLEAVVSRVTEEDDLQHSEEEDPDAEIDSFKQEIENCPGPLL